MPLDPHNSIHFAEFFWEMLVPQLHIEVAVNIGLNNFSMSLLPVSLKLGRSGWQLPRIEDGRSDHQVQTLCVFGEGKERNLFETCHILGVSDFFGWSKNVRHVQNRNLIKVDLKLRVLLVLCFWSLAIICLHIALLGWAWE